MKGGTACSLRLFIPSLVLLFWASACQESSDKDKGKPVAEAYGKKLTRSELQKRIPRSLNGADSQRVAETSVQNWVREQVLLRKAREELPSKKKDFEERIRDYRRSLMIHALEKEYLKKELDSTIDKTERRTYYQKNEKEFLLDGPIVKRVFVQLHQDSIRYLSAFMNALRKDSTARKKALDPLCEEHSLHCSGPGKRWVRLESLLTRTPFEAKDPERFLQKKGVRRLDKEGNIFLLRILDHRNSGELAPFSMVEEKVDRMIINERKRAIIERLHQNALLDAKKKDQVRVH